MKKFKEEELARRYCEYLGVEPDIAYSSKTKRLLYIKLMPKACMSCEDCELKQSLSATYYSWRSFFFGDSDTYGMCVKMPDGCYEDNHVWRKIDSKIIECGTLDELELQLAARGF